MVSLLILIATAAWAQDPGTPPPAPAENAATDVQPSDAPPSVPAPSAAAPPPTLRVFHAPRARAAADEPLDVTVTLNDIEAIGSLLLFYRVVGDKQWNELGFSRAGEGYVARIPAGAVLPPGVEYTIQSRGRGERLQPRFATTEAPFQVIVAGDSAAARQREALAAYDGHRSRFDAWGGAQSFGANRRGVADNQRDFGLDYTYRTLSFLHSLRFGFARTRGQSPDQYRPDVAVPAGYDRGSATAEFAPHPAVGFSTRAEIGADLTRFTAGYGLGLRLGPDVGTHVWITHAATRNVGFTSSFALRWDTVPHVPMTAAVDVSSWPVAQGPAVRLRYGVDVPIGEHLGVAAQISYQARDALAGSAGGQGGLSWSF